jgi:uncharacterized protein YjiS (DUF1127 family)
MSNIRQFHARRHAVALPVESTLPNVELPHTTFGKLAMAFGSRIAAATRRRRDARLLAHADDHMLRDMGIIRSQIDGAVRFGRF